MLLLLFAGAAAPVGAGGIPPWVIPGNAAPVRRPLNRPPRFYPSPDEPAPIVEEMLIDARPLHVPTTARLSELHCGIDARLLPAWSGVPSTPGLGIAALKGAGTMQGVNVDMAENEWTLAACVDRDGTFTELTHYFARLREDSEEEQLVLTWLRQRERATR